MKQWSFLAIALLAVLAACGGGGGGTSAPVVPQNAATSPAANATAGVVGTLKATLSLTVPNAVTGQGVRRAQTVASGTQSITLTLLQTNGVATSGTVQGPFALTAASPGCSSGANGVTCTFQIDAPIGDDIFVAQTYSTTTAAANTKLGSGAVAMTIKQNAQNTSNLTLNGPVASIILTANGYELGNAASPPVASIRVFAVALDAQNNIIVNPSTFDQPVHLKLAQGGSSPLIQLSVVYEYPNGGPASATTSTDGGVVDTTSPSDTITVSTVPGQSSSSYQYPTLTALLGTVTKATYSMYAYVPGPSPSPTASPTPCPAYYGGSPPSCTAPALRLGAQPSETAPARISAATNTVQFRYLTDTPVSLSVTPSTGTPAYAGTVTFSNGSTPCSTLGIVLSSSGSPYSLGTPVSATSGAYNLELALPTGSSPPPLSNGASCTIVATEDNAPNATSTITINVNNITGTIQ